MQLGYIGLGKMGKNMALLLNEKGHDLVVWNRSEGPRKELAAAGAVATETIPDLVEKLGDQRTIWLMLPAGKVTEDVLDQLIELLDSGDTIINGANEFYKNTIAHADKLAEKGINFLDAGVSGGQEGARKGACVMVGGKREIFEAHEEIFRDIAAPNAYQFFEGNGAGHFVKMVHNGIEYGMMQAIAEGFDILKNSNFNLDLKDAVRIYNQDSIIESRLIGWLESGFKKYGKDLDEVSDVAGSGGAAGMTQSEAKWTVEIANELNIPAKTIQSSIDARIHSQETPNYQAKIINVLRNQFGGHDLKKET